MPLRLRFSRKSDEESPDDALAGQVKSCPQCGSVVSEDLTKCPRCGTQLDEATTEKTDETEPMSRGRAALLFGRDIAVAFIIVGVVIGAIYAYTGVWPPMVVIESGSMQHSNTASYVGVIDTGDLVLVQAAPQRSDVTTWVEGRAIEYKTYGNYGDVIIFRKAGSDTPIIHRPIFWMDYDSITKEFSIPDLERLPHNVMWGGTYKDATPVMRPFNLDGTVWIKGAGWKGDLNITFYIDWFVTNVRHSGYVTLGDNNGIAYDRSLARQEDVIGRARGELPWFGLIKLTLFPSNTCCMGWGDLRVAKNSWDSLTISLVLAFATPILIDVSSSLWARRRKQKGEEEGEDIKPREETKSEEKPPRPSV